ncbi:hypothetical protein SAMN03159284_01097 [Mucilaginibacter sp. NFR10]|jgi:hypothetical protein|nr:hypothetical protein SAMN03159284_01097 [Mucilaginibacter sp. NFR10]
MSKYKFNKDILLKYGFEYRRNGLGKGSFMRMHEGRNYFINQTDENISIRMIDERVKFKREFIRLFPIYNDLELEFILNRSLRYISGIPIDESLKVQK